MSRLKLPTLPLVPLCLKIRGRIVGAVSKMTTIIYIGSGLLLLSSLLLFLVFIGVKYDQGVATTPEQSMESKVAALVEEQPVIIVAAPQPVPEAAPVISEQSVLVTPIPIKGEIVLDFGWQLHRVYHDWRYHTGIDISGSAHEPVKAIYSGQVADVLGDPHSGLTVVVKNKTYSIYYGSLAEVNVEKDGYIKAGQTIGTMGSCDPEPYSHLHLAIKKGDQYIDPKVVIVQQK